MRCVIQICTWLSSSRPVDVARPKKMASLGKQPEQTTVHDDASRKKAKPDTSNGKVPSESTVQMLKDVDSMFCGEHGQINLGLLLEWMDATSCLAAERHCGRYAVTLLMDDLDFASEGDQLVSVGESVWLEGKITRAFGSSMEVSVEVNIASSRTGSLRKLCHAYFMYVVLKTDEERAIGVKVEVPSLFPQTHEELFEYDLADKRKSLRMQRDKKVKEMSRVSFTQLSDCQPESAEGQPSVRKSLTWVQRWKKTANIVPGTVAPSTIVFTELVLPTHANHMGNTFGGQIMHWMTKGAAAACLLHISRCARAKAAGGEVSALVDAMRSRSFSLQPLAVERIHFKCPSRVGDRVQVRAAVTRLFRGHELEVSVRVSSASVSEQSSPPEVNEGFFLFAVKAGNDAADLGLFDIQPETVQQRTMYSEALGRHKFRLLRRETVPKLAAAKGDTNNPEILAADISEDTSQVESLATLCISGIISLEQRSGASWETLPCNVARVAAFVDREINTPGAHSRLRLNAKIKCQAKMCFEYLKDFRRHREWNDAMVEIDEPQSKSQDCELVRAVMASPHGESDLMLLRTWRELPGGKGYIIASRSVRADATPPKANRPRGNLLPSGYVITEGMDSDGEDEHAPTKVAEFTDLVFLVQLDNATFDRFVSLMIQLFDKLCTKLELEAQK